MKKDPSQSLNQFLTSVSEYLNKPFILFVDEIDALVGDSLVSHILIFNRDSSVSWDDKLFCLEKGYKGRKYLVWGM